ncbi:hypothetical protein D9M72_243060 [compost metagenome]
MRLSAAFRSAPATNRTDHDCEPSGSIAAAAHSLPAPSGRRFTEVTPAGSLMLVAAGSNAPSGSVRAPLSTNFLPSPGSGTPLGHTTPDSVAADGRRMPAPSRVPTGSVTLAPLTMLPAANSSAPAALRTSALSTVPTFSSSALASTLATGITCPAPKAVDLIGRS